MSVDPIEPCAKCGERHVRDDKPTCTAHKSGMRPCMNYPIRGGHVCRFHGGAAPQVRATAEHRELEQKLDRVMRFSIGNPTPRHRDMTPEEHMLETLAQASQAVAILSSWVERLEMHDEDEGEFANVVGIDEEGNAIIASQRFEFLGIDHNRDLAVHPLVALLERWIDRRAKIAFQCAQIGISDRMVRLAENQAGLLINVISAVLDGLALSDAQRNEAHRIVAGKLRLVAATETTGKLVEGS